MTLNEAKKLTYGQVIYYCGAFNADGTPQRWRVNGKVKLWKTRPKEIKIPIKWGLYHYDYIDEHSIDMFFLEEKDCF